MDHSGWKYQNSALLSHFLSIIIIILLLLMHRVMMVWNPKKRNAEVETMMISSLVCP